MRCTKRVIARWVVIVSAPAMALVPAQARADKPAFDWLPSQLLRCAVRAEQPASLQTPSGVGAARLLSQIGAALAPLSEPNAAPPLGPAGRRLLVRKVVDLLGGAMPGNMVRSSVLASGYTTAVSGYLNRVGNYIRATPLRNRSVTVRSWVKAYESLKDLDACLREVQRRTPTRVRGRVFAKVAPSGAASRALTLIAQIARGASNQQDADIAVDRIARITGAAVVVGDIPEHYALTYGPNAVRDLFVNSERETSSLAGANKRSKANVNALAQMGGGYLDSLMASLSALKAALVAGHAKIPLG